MCDLTDMLFLGLISFTIEQPVRYSEINVMPREVLS